MTLHELSARRDPVAVDNPRHRRFEALYAHNYRPLLGYAFRRVDDAASAADVVSETFLVAWRRLDDVPAGDEARRWLYGTARRVLANYRRGNRRRTALTDRLASHVQAAIPAPNETAIALREALDRLDDDDAELIRLIAWEGLSPTEIASMWNIPAPTVRTRLHRARSRLKSLIGDERMASTGHGQGDGQALIRYREETS